MGGVGEGRLNEADFISKEEHLKILEMHDMEMRRAIKDSIIGAIIQDLRGSPDTVSVMVRWSREFYDQIAAVPDA